MCLQAELLLGSAQSGGVEGLAELQKSAKNRDKEGIRGAAGAEGAWASGTDEEAG